MSDWIALGETRLADGKNIPPLLKYKDQTRKPTTLKSKFIIGGFMVMATVILFYRMILNVIYSGAETLADWHKYVGGFNIDEVIVIAMVALLYLMILNVIYPGTETLSDNQKYVV